MSLFACTKSNAKSTVEIGYTAISTLFFNVAFKLLVVMNSKALMPLISRQEPVMQTKKASLLLYLVGVINQLFLHVYV